MIDANDPELVDEARWRHLDTSYTLRRVALEESRQAAA